jgi:hypothetical protein
MNKEQLQKECENIINGYSWIKVKSFKNSSNNDEFLKLEQHHIEETTFLINKTRELASIILELTKNKNL